MNTNFFSSGFESNSNFYNPDWSNHHDFSWQVQTMRNRAPQFQELHHSKYPQFKNQVLNPSSYDPFPKKLSSEDTLIAFIQESIQNLQELQSAIVSNIQELQNAAMSNSQNIQELKSVKANFSSPRFYSNSNFYKLD
jgi:hypothetical protein